MSDVPRHLTSVYLLALKCLSAWNNSTTVGTGSNTLVTEECHQVCREKNRHFARRNWLLVGQGSSRAWLAKFRRSKRRCKQMLYWKMKHILWSTYFSFPWVLHFSRWRGRTLVHRVQCVRFRTCWIHTCQVLLRLAIFNLTFVECFVNSAKYVPTLQPTYYRNFICFSPLMVKLSPGQVSFRERDFSYFSDRNR